LLALLSIPLPQGLPVRCTEGAVIRPRRAGFRGRSTRVVMRPSAIRARSSASSVETTPRRPHTTRMTPEIRVIR
jgi:hypothetical protein